MTTNRPWRRWAAALLAAGLARAQDSGELEWAVAWVEAVAELSSKERFGPEDLASFLEHYASFQELGTAEDRGRERFLREGKYRFDLVLKHKPYLDWAKARGLDAERWLRRSVRILAVETKRRMGPHLAELEGHYARQLKLLEQSRSDLDEAAYAELRRELERAAAAVKRLRAAAERLPDPAEEEAKLLAKRRKEIDALLEKEVGDAGGEE